MAEILSGARKYRIGLILAHHELHQLQRNSDVASAVMAHPFTRIVFRVGDDDARKLSEGFSFFEGQDFKNLEAGRAIARVERSTFDFNLSVPLPEPIDELQTAQRRQQVITASREKYGTPRAGVEAMLREVWQEEEPQLKKVTKGSLSATESLPIETPETAVSQITEHSKAPKLPKEPVAKIESPEALPLSSVSPILPQTPEPPLAVAPRAAEPVAGNEVCREPPPPRELGKGGAQHTVIQKRIKEAGQSAGFLCKIETELPGHQSVVVALEKDGQKIACEISITTTVDHEIRNVKKCLESGFTKVAVICVEEARLQKIEKAVARSLGPDLAAKVRYYLPDEFIEELKARPLPKPTEQKVRGYKVKRTAAGLTPEEQKQKEEIAIRSIAETMKKKK
jgi:hypothetical protein